MFSNIVIMFINLINKLIPKVKQRVVISTFPDYDDMTRAIVEEESVTILLGDRYSKKPLWLPESVNTVQKKSLIGLWYLVTSSKIYFTHGLYRGFKTVNSNKQLVINLWHGMPIKNIGFLDGKREVPDFHIVYSSSEFFCPILAKAFNVDIERVLISKLPRNKILCRGAHNKSLLFLKEKYSKVIVWLPTYRKSTFGDVRTDSENSEALILNDLNLHDLNIELIKNKALLIIKPHPMALRCKVLASLNFSNILVINEDWLVSRNATLYELLSYSSELWTDFSSVAIDYMSTGKTIKFIIPDFDSYKSNRGFTFDIGAVPLPGETIQTHTELLQSLKENKKIAYNSHVFLK